MKITNMLMRGAARVAAVRQGYEVQIVQKKGVLPGARLDLSKSGEVLRAAVRTSQERALGFSRHANNKWRTLGSAGIHVILLAVPSDRVPTIIEVYAFDASGLVSHFDAALVEIMRRGKKPPPNSIPIFIPLDERSEKDFGHSIRGIKLLAIWDDKLDSDELNKSKSAGTVSELMERAKQEYAELVGIDVRKVTVEFRIIG